MKPFQETKHEIAKSNAPLLCAVFCIVLVLMGCTQKFKVTNFYVFEKPPGASEVLGAEGGTATIAEGLAAGSQVKVLKGSVPLGTKLYIAPAKRPKEFVILQHRDASAPIEVKAIKENGELVEFSAFAMEVSIALKADPALFGLSELPKKESVCVLGNTVTNKSFVYLNEDLKIDGKIATLRTKRFGIFQAVFCDRDLFAKSDRDVDRDNTGTKDRLDPPPPDPTQLSYEDVTANSATLRWVSGGKSTVDFSVRLGLGLVPPANCSEGTTVVLPKANSTYVAVSGLFPSLVYSARICALNDNPKPDFSKGATLSFRTNQNPPPDPKAGLVTVSSNAALTLTWTSQGGTTEGFLVRYAKGSLAPAQGCKTGLSIPSENQSPGQAQLNGLDSGSEYTFRICAYNKNTPPDLSEGLIVTGVTSEPPPPDPSSLVIVPNSTTSLAAHWQSGGGVTKGFKISYSSGNTDPIINCNQAQSVQVSPLNASSFTLIGNPALASGTNYRVRLCAFNGNTPPDYSAGVVVTGRTFYAPPQNPITPIVSARTKNSIELSWTPPGGTAVAYKIAYQSGSVAPINCNTGTVVESLFISGSTYNTMLLDSFTDYSFRICSLNANSSPDMSAGVVVNTVTLKEPPPEIGSLIQVELLDTSVSYTWSSGSGSTTGFLASYKIGSIPPATCLSDNPINFTDPSQPQFTLTDLTSDSSYSIRVCASNDNTPPDITSGLTVSFTTHVSPPAGIVVTPKVLSVEVAWTASIGATQYRVYHSPTSPVTTSSPFILVTSSPASITGLGLSAAVFVRVAAVKNSYVSQLSNQTISAETAGPPPVTPVKFNVGSAPGNAIYVSFDKASSPSAVKFRAFYSTSPLVSNTDSFFDLMNPDEVIPGTLLTSKTVYHVKLAAVDQYDQVSTLTVLSSAMTSAFVSIPQNRASFRYLGTRAINSVLRTASALYAATDGGGLSVSFDNGEYWVTRTTANGLGHNRVKNVTEIDGVLIASTAGGVSKSTNQGLSWTNYSVSNGLPSNEVNAIVATSSTAFYACTSGGLAMTQNGGTSWTVATIANGLGSNICNDVDVVGSNVYLATAEGVALSTDNGNSFITKNTTHGLGSNNTKSIFVSGSRVFVGTDNGLSSSANDGTSYTSATTTNGLPSLNVTGLWYESDTLFVTTDTGLARSDNQGASFSSATLSEGVLSTKLRSVHMGQGKITLTSDFGFSEKSFSTSPVTLNGKWINRSTLNGISQDDVRWVFEDNGTYYVGTESGGISISTNSGVTWLHRTSQHGLPNNQVRWLGKVGSRLMATTDGGLAFSTDSGLTWSAHTSGLPSIRCYGAFVDGAVVYVGTYLGIAKSTDSGATFAPLTTINLPDRLTNSIWAVGSKVYAATYKGLAVSNDSGVSFQAVNNLGVSANTQTTSIYVNGTIVLVGTSVGLSVSLDGGATFVLRSLGTTGLDTIRYVTMDGGLIYVATAAGVGRSADNGQTWTFFTKFQGLGINSINHIIPNGQILLVGTDEGGLGISQNGGASFVSVTSESGFGGVLSQGNALEARRVSASGNQIYVATAAGLLFSLDGGYSWSNKRAVFGNGDIKDVAIGSSVFVAHSTGLGAQDPDENWINRSGGGLPSGVNNGVAANETQVALGNDSGVYISTDFNIAFQSRPKGNNGLQNSNINDVSAYGNRWLAATNLGVALAGDLSGLSWTPLTLGLPSLIVRTAAGFGATIVAATPNGLGLSTNNGVNFTAVGTAEGLPGLDCRDVIVGATYLLVGTNMGLGLSINGGASFSQFTTQNGLGSEKVKGLAVNGNQIFVSTEDAGLSVGLLP